MYEKMHLHLFGAIWYLSGPRGLGFVVIVADEWVVEPPRPELANMNPPKLNPPLNSST